MEKRKIRHGSCENQRSGPVIYRIFKMCGGKSKSVTSDSGLNTPLGHDYLDAAWKSRLPNEHPLEHCVKQSAIIGRFPSFPPQRAVAVPVPLQIPHFPGLELESQSWQCFCDVTPMTTPINQSIKSFRKYSPLIDHCRKLRKGKKPKKLLWLGFEPRTWKRGMWRGSGTVCWIAAHAWHAVKPRCRGKQGKRFMIAHCFTQCSSGCSLGSLLFPRQNHRVQRCTVQETV